MRDGLESILAEKIQDLASLKGNVLQWKEEGKKIVFTNGVFDLIHIGHISYLLKAAEAGDKLIIGLNADISVKRIKGDSRPINDESSRLALLAAFFLLMQ